MTSPPSQPARCPRRWRACVRRRGRGSTPGSSRLPWPSQSVSGPSSSDARVRKQGRHREGRGDYTWPCRRGRTFQMPAAALNLTTQETGSQRVLFVCLPQRGAEAELATALDRLEEGIENVHGVAEHRLEEAFQRGCVQYPRRRPHGSRRVNVRARELVNWRQVGRGG